MPQWSAKSTVISKASGQLATMRAILSHIGAASRAPDKALPGPHTKLIYDAVGREDAHEPLDEVKMPRKGTAIVATFRGMFTAYFYFWRRPYDQVTYSP